MHIVDHIALRREENSRCLSLARVRKASRPSIKSHGMSGSGSEMGGKELAAGPAMRRITKNTWKTEKTTFKLHSKTRRAPLLNYTVFCGFQYQLEVTKADNKTIGIMNRLLHYEAVFFYNWEQVLPSPTLSCFQTSKLTAFCWLNPGQISGWETTRSLTQLVRIPACFWCRSSDDIPTTFAAGMSFVVEQVEAFSAALQL